MARFMWSGEAESFDFTSNKAWFNIKLLTDSWGFADNNISVTDQAYASNMKNACRHLGIISKHFVHSGRSAECRSDLQKTPFPTAKEFRFGGARIFLEKAGPYHTRILSDG